MSIRRRELSDDPIKHGDYLLREGSRQSIYTDGKRIIPVKRHRVLDRITANEICKQAGLKPPF